MPDSAHPWVTPARAARTRRRQQLKAAVAAVVAALAVGGIAGAVSLGQPDRRTAPTSTGIAAAQGGPGAASAGTTATATDPAAMEELCQAYLADREAGLDAAAFRALAAATGGAGNVPAWCQAVAATPVGGRRQGEPGGPPGTQGNGRGRDRRKGPPADRGRGHGGPPTTSH